MKNRSIIVDKISLWVAPIIFIFGIYVILYGHISPGGGFPGGVILSSAFILVLLSKGRSYALHRLPLSVAKKLDAGGALFFLAIALSGLAVSRVFFGNFIIDVAPGQPMRLISGGIIMPGNLAIGLKVSASLFLVMFTLSVLRISMGKDEEIQSFEED